MGCASDGLDLAPGMVSLPLPVRPVLPVIEPEALGCLSAGAYEALVMRDALLQAHVRRLEGVIGSTHSSRGSSKRDG